MLVRILAERGRERSAWNRSTISAKQSHRARQNGAMPTSCRGPIWNSLLLPAPQRISLFPTRQVAVRRGAANRVQAVGVVFGNDLDQPRNVQKRPTNREIP